MTLTRCTMRTTNNALRNWVDFSSRAINQWRIQEGVGGGYDPFRDLTEEIFSPYNLAHIM